MRIAGGGTAVADVEVTDLLYELLDAHVDTIALTGADPQEWDAHLDYLRDLQRLGREVLARIP
jgi:hypothetical protein